MAMETGNERQCFGDKIPPAAPPGAPPSGIHCALLASAAVIWVLGIKCYVLGVGLRTYYTAAT